MLTELIHTNTSTNLHPSVYIPSADFFFNSHASHDGAEYELGTSCGTNPSMCNGERIFSRATNIKGQKTRRRDAPENEFLYDLERKN